MMQSWHVADLTSALGATLHGANVLIDRVGIDSREIQPDALFVALSGAHHDGHDFVAEVAQRGAAAALVQKRQPVPLPQLEVADCRAALAHLGRENRRLFQGPVVGITGSAGKTTCKDMLAAILAGSGPVLATHGNRNNEIGLPLTLLELQPRHRYAVLEMGAARAGDIAWLCQFALPDVALVTNAMAAHLEGFGDIETVAATKGEIYAAVADRGTAVIDLDSPFHGVWRGLAGDARQLTFSASHPDADVHARNVVSLGTDGLAFDLQLQGISQPVRLALLGRHNVANACAAAAAALALGIAPQTIAEGLGGLRAAAGRLAPIACGDRWLIDDSYNANPGAVRAAIDVLAECAGTRALVLGEMAELGRDSDRYHREAGAYAAASGIEQLWAVGPSAPHTVAEFGAGGRAFTDRAALLEALPQLHADLILVKGSRSAGMEHAVAALTGLGSSGGQH